MRGRDMYIHCHDQCHALDMLMGLARINISSIFLIVKTPLHVLNESSAILRLISPAGQWNYSHSVWLDRILGKICHQCTGKGRLPGGDAIQM